MYIQTLEVLVGVTEGLLPVQQKDEILNKRHQQWFDVKLITTQNGPNSLIPQLKNHIQHYTPTCQF